MSTATVSRTVRKPRTAASLIASEFARYQTPEPSPWAEIAAPIPSDQPKVVPTTENQAADPVILVLIAFVVVTVLVKVLIALTLITAKITKKIAAQVAAFWSAQMGSREIDYRVYSPIFDL